MSRARAQRRAEREQLAARAREARSRRDARRAGRRARLRSLRARLPRRTRWQSQQGLLDRRRRAQNATIVGLYLVVQAIIWLVTADPWARATGALLGLLAIPVLVTLVLDRRS